MSYLSDAHTHLDHFPPVEIPEILERAREAQVGLIICAGTTLASSKSCGELAQKYDLVYAGVGLHPMNLEGPVDDAACETLRDLALGNPKVVCISEIGLDFLPSSPDRDLQYQALRRQIGLARELTLPIIFHSRESHSEVLRTLREERGHEVGGIMHYFQADEAVAKEALELGFFISLAKPLLRLPELQELAKKLPLDKIVLETDAAPQPWKRRRRQWTEPSHVRMVADKLAELKGLTVEEVISATTANLKRLLKLG